MSQNPNPTKRDRKEAARAERLERERADAAAQTRRKRLTTLGGLLAAAVVIVVVAVVISSGGGDKGSSGGDPSSIQGAADTAAMLKGIPQDGITLGKASAPATIVEFADPQCPFCKQYTLNEMPAVIQDQVRTGKAKMELRFLTFIGPDSIKAASALQATTKQNRFWNASDLFYRNQGEENSGYVTDDFLTGVLNGAGADAAKAIAASGDPAVTQGLGEAKTLASRYAVQSTPTILVGPTGGDLKPVDATASAIGKAVDQAAAKAGT